jgi:hypothetical protein
MSLEVGARALKIGSENDSVISATRLDIRIPPSVATIKMKMAFATIGEFLWSMAVAELKLANWR